MDWFYEQNGQAAGPVTEDALRELVRNGAVGRDCRVWCQAFGSEWRRAADVPELRAEMPPQPNGDLHPGTHNRDLMTRAREILFKEKKLWPAVIAFIVTSMASFGVNMLDLPFRIAFSFGHVLPRDNTVVFISIAAAFILLYFAVLVVTTIISIVLSFGPLHYFLKLARRENAQITDLFFMFQGRFWSSRRFWTLVWGGLRVGIFVFLWMLLFIIPGIVAMYSYAMTYYILLDNPGMSARDAMARSKQIMRGYRLKLLCLGLRFFGWGLLCGVGVLFCGIGLIGFLILVPYINTSMALFYESVKSRA